MIISTLKNIIHTISQEYKRLKSSKQPVPNWEKFEIMYFLSAETRSQIRSNCII